MIRAVVAGAGGVVGIGIGIVVGVGVGVGASACRSASSRAERRTLFRIVAAWRARRGPCFAKLRALRFATLAAA